MPHFGEVGGVSTDDFIVTREANSFVVKDHLGNVRYVTAGLVDALQWCHDQLPNGGAFGLRGNGFAKAWEATLTISNDGITFHGSNIKAGTLAGEFTAQAIDGLDADMIAVTGKKCYVHTLTLHGNSTNQASGRGIFNGSGPAGDLHLANVYILDTKDIGIDWSGSAGFAYGVYAEYIKAIGILVAGDRNVFVQCGTYSCTSAGWRIVGEHNRLLGCISASNTGAYGDGIILEGAGCQYNDLIAFHTHENARYGIFLYGCTKNNLVGGIQENNTNHGVYMATLAGPVYTVRNIINSMQMHGNGGWGIFAADADQDNNTVTSCIILGNTTGQLNASGSTWVEDNNQVV